ncbi:MFS transporter [Francisella sp. W12-1067]
MHNESHLPNQKLLIIMAWIICLIATLNYSYDFFIRAAPGVMSHSLADAFNINSAKIGWLSSAYFISYTLMQIPAGVIIDKYNRKTVIGVATGLCVLGNYLFSATNYYEIAFTGRILMGIGSAFGFIGAAKMAAMWLPQRFFSTFISFTTIVGILGGLVTDTVLSSLVNNFGWKQGNNVFTYFGVVLFILIIIFIKDNPKHVQKFSHINESSFKQATLRLLSILTNVRFWVASTVGATMFMPINVLGSLWGVSFIQTKLNVPEVIASHINSFLFIGAAVGFGIFGIIAAYTNRFRLMIIISLSSLAILTSILMYIPLDRNTFILLYFLLGAMIGPQAITFTIAKVISPPGASGSSTACVNIVNNLIPIVLLPTIGYILSRHGSMISGSNLYDITSYQHAFITILIPTIICLPVAMFLPKRIKI